MSNMRKTVMVKREFQQHLMLQTILMTFLVLNITIIVSFFASDFLGTGPELFRNMVIVLASLEILGVVVVYLVSKRISFHIAGPVYAIERSLRELQDGDLTGKLALRDGDFFHEAAQTLNTTTSTLRERIATLQKLAENIDSESHELAQVIDSLAQFSTHANEEKQQSTP